MEYKLGDKLVARVTAPFITRGKNYEVHGINRHEHSVIIKDDHGQLDEQPAKFFDYENMAEARDFYDRVKDKFKAELKDILFKSILTYILKKRFGLKARTVGLLIGIGEGAVRHRVTKIRKRKAEKRVREIMSQLENE